jgi:hypothetical protein
MNNRWIFDPIALLMTILPGDLQAKIKERISERNRSKIGITGTHWATSEMSQIVEKYYGREISLPTSKSVPSLVE